MAQKTDIRLRRSNVLNSVPGAANLSDGELAMNTNTGALYFKKSDATIITAADNTIFHIDSDTDNSGANKKIGIGTTSPVNTLHVDSGSDDWPLRAQSTDAKAGIIIQDTNTTNYLISQSYTLSLGNQASVHAANLNIKSTGSVGIGNTNPPQKLTVNGAVFVTSSLTSPGSAGTYTYNGTAVDYNNDGTRYWSWGSGTARGKFDFIQLENDGTNQQTAMSIATSGNVGIGTSAPADKLDVHGNITLTNAIPKITFTDSDTSTDASISANSSHLTYTTAAASRDHIFKQDTTERMRITDVGVGIGTTSPTETLHVMSGTNNDTVAIITGAQADRGLTISTFLTDGRNDGGVDFKAFKGISFTTDSLERARIDSSGNVGIGTSSPSGELHVVGTGGGNGDVYVGRTSGAEIHTQAQSATGIFGTSSNHDLAFKTNDTQRVRIDTSGNVGIGTTTPSEVLTLDDTNPKLALRDAGTERAYFQVDASDDLLINNKSISSTKFYTSDAERFIITSTGYLRVNHNSGWNTLGTLTVKQKADGEGIGIIDTDGQNTLEILNEGNLAQFAYNVNNPIVFSQQAGERMRINGSGHLLVGTTSAGNSSAGFRAYAGGNGAFTIAGTVLDLNRLSSDGTILQLQKDTSNVGSIGTKSGDIYIAGLDGDHAALRFAASPKAVLPVTNVGALSNAAVDLGQSNAQFKDIHLSGVANAAGFQSNQTTTGFGYVNFGDTDDANIGQIGYDHTDNYMRFQVNNTEKVRIIANGNVGIGTTTPAHNLTVSSPNNTTALGIDIGSSAHFDFQANSTSGYTTTFYMDDTGLEIGHDSTSRNLALQTGNTDRLVIAGNGKVGIGTASPASPLDVISDSNALGLRVRGRTSDDIGQIDLANNSGTVRSQLQWNNSFLNIKAIAAIPMIFYTNNAERMRIQSNGAVGIGTTSPLDLLHIKSSSTDARFLLDGHTDFDAEIKYAEAGAVKFTTGFDAATDKFVIGTTNVDTQKRFTIDSSGKITFNEAFTFPTSIGSAGQVLKVPTSGTELIWGAASGGGGGSSIEDNDGDTKIQVEESADEDVIRFDIAGTQKMSLSSTHLDLTGDLQVSGNLNIAGDINSTSVTNLDVTDKTITMANNAGSSTAADGAGIIIEGPSNNASLLWDHANQYLEFNKEVFSPAGFVIGTTGTKVGRMYNSSGVMALEAYSTRQISFGNADNGEHVRIDANGNVGIGTTSPSGLLSLAKGTRTLDVKLETSPATGDVGVQFRAGTGDYLGLAAGGGTAIGLVVDDSNKVGIGTISPSKKLHIQDSAAHQLQLHGGNSYWNIGAGWSGYYQDYLLFATNTGEKMVIDTNGNVGLGTNGPSAKLHIVNNSTSTDALLLESTEDSSSAAPILAFKRNSASVADADYLGQLKFKGENDADQDVVYAKITAKIQDATDGTEDGLIEFANRKAGSNNIGMRLRSDSLQLLNGTNLKIADDASQMQFGSGNDMQIFHNGANGEINNATGDFTIDSVGDITLDADGGDIRLKDDGTQFARLTNFLGSLIITSGANDTAMIIGNNDGSMIMGGHVTLGDNNKSKYGGELEIYTNGTNAYIDEVGGGNLFIRSNEVRINKYTGEYMIRAIADGAVTLYYDNNAKLATKADGVDITGELQADSLDIDGNADITGNLVVAGGTHTFYSAENDIDFSIGRDLNQALHIDVDDANIKLTADQDSDTNGNHEFILDRTFEGTGANNFSIRKSGSTQFLINTDGKVGIGTTSPAAALDVQGSSALFMTRTSSGLASYIENNSGYASLYLYQIGGSPKVAIHGNGASYFNGGNVGIGTSSPGHPLHVSFSGDNGAEIQSTDNHSSLYINSHTGKAQYIRFEEAGSNKYWIQSTGGKLVFRPGATSTVANQVTFDSTGKVGIGTNSLTNKFHVSGDARVEGNFMSGGASAGNVPARAIHIKSSGSNAALRIEDTTSSNQIWDLRSTQGTGLLFIDETAGATRMTINTAGNVGVGVTSIPSWANFMTNGTAAIGGILYVKQDQKIQALTAFPGGAGYLRINPDGGNVGIGMGSSTPKAKLQVEEYGIDTSETSTSATTQVTIHSFPIADFRTARFTIQITNSTDSTYHSTEIIAVHDGTNANITEFGEVHTGSSVEATFDADISSNNFRLRATPTSTNSMEFKVVCHSITV